MQSCEAHVALAKHLCAKLCANSIKRARLSSNGFGLSCTDLPLRIAFLNTGGAGRVLPPEPMQNGVNASGVRMNTGFAGDPEASHAYAKETHKNAFSWQFLGSCHATLLALLPSFYRSRESIVPECAPFFHSRPFGAPQVRRKNRPNCRQIFRHLSCSRPLHAIIVQHAQPRLRGSTCSVITT